MAASKMSKLTVAESIELMRLYTITGDVSYRNEIVNRCSNMIWKQVNLYSGNMSISEREDLYHEGVMGFIRGLDVYDGRDSSVWPISIAIVCARNAIMHSLVHYDAIRVPYRSHHALRTYKKRIRESENLNGCSTSLAVSSVLSDHSASVRYGVLSLLDAGRIVSLATIEEHVSMTDDDYEGSMNGAKIEFALRALHSLRPKDRELLQCYFGLSDVSGQQYIEAFRITDRQYSQRVSYAIKRLCAAAAAIQNENKSLGSTS